MSEKPTEPSHAVAKISQEEALKEFRALHPNFEVCWHDCLKDLEEEDLVSRMVYGRFASEINEILDEDPTTDCVPIMQYVETLMRDGDKEVGDIVAVYFIEALLAVADIHPERMAPVLRLLGPLSRAYALEWNKFLGAQNKGLEK